MVLRRSVRQKSRPCLTAAVVEEMAAVRPADDLKAQPARSPEPFSRRERLMLHVGMFLIGSWNLLVINLARSPDHLWFWPWVTAWAGALMLHLAYVWIASRARRRIGPGLKPKLNIDDGGTQRV